MEASASPAHYRQPARYTGTTPIRCVTSTPKSSHNRNLRRGPAFNDGGRRSAPGTSATLISLDNGVVGLSLHNSSRYVTYD